MVCAMPMHIALCSLRGLFKHCILYICMTTGLSLRAEKCRKQPLKNKLFAHFLLCVLQDLLSYKGFKIVPFQVKFNVITIYFPHNLLQTVNFVSTCEWFICQQNSLCFLHCSNIHKLWENIFKFIVLSIISARPSTILSVVREIIRMKKL